MEFKRSSNRQSIRQTEQDVADSDNSERERSGKEQILRERDLPGKSGRSSKDIGEIWTTAPNVGRVADGVPRRLDRLKCLGNAVVPQVAQFLGERIREWERCNETKEPGAKDS